MSRNFAENVDLLAILRTIDQGVIPGLIIIDKNGMYIVCSGYSMIVTEDTIVITFSPINLVNIYVECSLYRYYPGPNGVAIPNSEWWLMAETKNTTG